MTAFIGERGGAAACELLGQYRSGERHARFEGSEIRTEGGSFCVVLRSVGDAAEAGLANLDVADRLHEYSGDDR